VKGDEMRGLSTMDDRTQPRRRVVVVDVVVSAAVKDEKYSGHGHG
jgi:hypothetical protein